MDKHQLETAFEQAIKPHLSPGDLGLVMGEFRSIVLAGAMDVPEDLREFVLACGEATWVASEPKTRGQHIDDFACALGNTDRDHLLDDETAMHAVEVGDKILCLTGNSPKGGTVARLLTGLWNHLHGLMKE